MSKPAKWDFDGWATKNDILCTDGRTIKDGAFAAQNGVRVPLVYQHDHGNPESVLGHCDLEYVPGKGMYAYGSFNNNPRSQEVKELVRHGDLNSMSIWANELKQNGGDVIHGSIKEVSLVLAGANKGAKIVNTYFAHADGTTTEYDDEAIINFYEPFNVATDVAHADEGTQESDSKSTDKEDKEMPDTKDKTLEDVIKSMTEEQKNVLYFLVAKAAEGEGDTAEHSDFNEGDDDVMKHNLFDNETSTEVLAHADCRDAIISDGLFDKEKIKMGKVGSMKDFVLSHAAEYGIDNIEWLFPDARELNIPPEFIKRDDSWVDDFMNGAKHAPFSRVKTTFANITADEARAKGYTKKNRKVEEVITLSHRSTDPTTIYKKQKFDRDDVIDITDFDVVVWIKMEMRMMLNEEIARAALIGDGRSTASPDHIDHTKIIPIWGDDELFTIPIVVHVSETDTDEAKADKIIKAVKKNFRFYKGSGNPTGYFSGEWTTNFTLIEDSQGRTKYDTPADAAKAMRVKKLVDVEVMENVTRTVVVEGGSSETRKLAGIIVNPTDYRFGADKGGAVAMFDDFDINYNQMIYLMEARCSGMLVKPYSAFSVELVEDAAG